MGRSGAAEPDPLFAGGGETGQVMAGLDWAANPLGPPATWPSALRSAVRILLTSRFAMCESSCASTPSTSRGSRRRQSPVVTATAACFGLRPVAKAFGTSLSITATFGLGRSAIAHSRSIIVCSSGASCSLTTLAPDAARASLSEVKYWKNASPTTISSIGMRPTFRTWKRTTAKPTYSAPSSAPVNSIRKERPASRP